MNVSKFIRFRKDIIKFDDIQEVTLNHGGDTVITYSTKGHSHWFAGDVRDEFWELIKFAMQPKGESYPSDTTHLEQRIEGIEKKIGKSFTTQNQVPNATIKAAKQQQSLKEKIVIGYTELGHPVYGV